MKKVLFLIHDLGEGGAEKVLVNLVNNLDKTKFDVTVQVLFGGGVNRQFLSDEVTYRKSFKYAVPGNSHLMKLLTPKQLYRWLIKDQYHVVVSYLEGPTARILAGCPNEETKCVSWIHIEQHTRKKAAYAFRSIKEAERCYQKFDRTICVSEGVKQDFTTLFQLRNPVDVLYNTNETEKILEQGKTRLKENSEQHILVGMGKIVKTKGFDRLARITNRLNQEGIKTKTWILGRGPEQEVLEKYVHENHLSEKFVFKGYQTNPYQYLAQGDLFVCASYAEGFSTAATEAIILGLPVVSTKVAGMTELLGEHDEYGVITENDEEALYQGIKNLLKNKDQLQDYRQRAKKRGEKFYKEQTVSAVEEMLLRI